MYVSFKPKKPLMQTNHPYRWKRMFDDSRQDKVTAVMCQETSAS